MCKIKYDYSKRHDETAVSLKSEHLTNIPLKCILFISKAEDLCMHLWSIKVLKYANFETLCTWHIRSLSHNPPISSDQYILNRVHKP